MKGQRWMFDLKIIGQLFIYRKCRKWRRWRPYRKCRKWRRRTVSIQPPQGTKWRSIQTRQIFKVKANHLNCFQREIRIKVRGWKKWRTSSTLELSSLTKDQNPRFCYGQPRQQQLFLDWRSYGGIRTSRLLLRISWCGRSSYPRLTLCLWELDLDSWNREKDPSLWDAIL